MLALCYIWSPFIMYIIVTYCLFFNFLNFFNSYLAAPRPTSGHSQGGCLTNPILITVLSISTWWSQGASQRGWVHEPGQAPSGVWTGNLIVTMVQGRFSYTYRATVTNMAWSNFSLLSIENWCVCISEESLCQLGYSQLFIVTCC